MFIFISIGDRVFQGEGGNHFPDLNLGLLESNSEEEVGEVRDEEICIEDLFNPTHEDWAVEDVASALPPTIIIPSDHVEVNESRTPDGA